MNKKGRALVSLREYVDVRLEGVIKSAEYERSSIDTRFANTNEWKQTVADQQKNFPTRDEVNSLIQARIFLVSFVGAFLTVGSILLTYFLGRH